MEASSDEVKEVYARFGLAYYYAEVLHRGICNLYAFSRIPERGGMTRPRFEEYLSEAFSSTLGQILSRVVPLLPEQLVARLEAALDRRNFLAHRFWYERIELMTTSEGVSQLIGELSECTEEFQLLNADIEECVEPFMSRAAVTDDMVQQALASLLRGEPEEAMIRQRRPKKHEVIVAVYDVPVEGAGSALIFQADDATLWQLCDAGLGWTPYDQVEATWRPAEAFSSLLPAPINPRPPMEKPWYFEIPFGHGATLVVRPGRERQQFRWRIRGVNDQTSCK
jgi:hypothetical protein